eukprot:30952-Pelagococcus_subviridis.AAC.8
MAAIASMSVAARVAAPKVRSDSRCRARASLRARIPRRASARAIFRSSRHSPVTHRATPRPSSLPPLRRQVTARRSFLGKGVSGLAPARYVRSRIDRVVARRASTTFPRAPSRVRSADSARPGGR